MTFDAFAWDQFFIGVAVFGVIVAFAAGVVWLVEIILRAFGFADEREEETK